jgi:hypothetical protein
MIRHMNSTHQLYKTDPPRGVPRDPMDRMHAPYAIARLLEANDLRYWTAPVLSLLANYDGFERFIPTEIDPAICLRDLWTKYAANNTKIETGQVHLDICSLQVLHYQAAWVNLDSKAQRCWNPLCERWLDFESQDEKGEALQVWFNEEACPDHYQVRAHLLSAKLRMNGTER